MSGRALRGPTAYTTALHAGSEYTDEQFAWLKAVASYTQARHKRHLGPGEILALAHALGYRKVAEPVPPRLLYLR